MANAVVLVYLSLLANSVFSLLDDDAVCKRVSSCRCETEDGIIMDLTTMLLPDDKFLSAEKHDLVYYYHGCVDTKFEIAQPNKTGTDACFGQTIAACLRTSDNQTFIVGHSKDSVFSDDPNGLTQITYEFNNEKKIKVTTVITMICTPESKENELVIHSIDDQQHHLHLFTKSACKFKVEQSLSVGSKLVIMLFVFSLVYLVGGGCISYFLRGARGREIVPHVEFWVGLPGLVKDGFVFLLNGCNPTMVSTAEAYDEI
ncbi:PREDICTED: uncharacterized protein LOC108564602 [Nicrophorus vespilloides]|uniref:Uncharacterized protein LOC108564602 n=1 Tax=Nicrophorus vespilloides TaxID=110193 RepID=A0ABM1MX92_NICVS|nr:PREDICTED: uncharacterized protein LOC108564602 [Nicrophorus vespilloides]